MTRDELITAYNEGRRDFICANLRDANLRDADLRDADLRDANLRGANLRGANISDADLRDADLRDADLRDADLRGANLRGANISDANISDADLRGAYLRGAYLSHNSTIIYACLGEYQMCLQQMSDGVRVIAGCRYFKTIKEAGEHWSEGNEKEWTAQTAAYGSRQRRMLAFLADEARLRGWIHNRHVERTDPITGIDPENQVSKHGDCYERLTHPRRSGQDRQSL
jgi:hypothetical protein